MRRKFLGIAIAASLLATGVALGQRADQNTGGPTKNTLGMKVVEPTDGATIPGDAVRVAVGYNTQSFATGQGTRFGEPNYPQPRFDVYVDDVLKTTLKGTESNVATISGISPGSHKIVVVAKNVSGEVIDRKEIDIQTVPVVAEKAIEPVKPAAEPVKTEAVAPAPPPPASVAAEPPISEKKGLPKTASPYAALALAGAALLTTGLLLARKVR
jgi:LPXTG-motif cell wall-anchored protein